MSDSTPRCPKDKQKDKRKVGGKIAEVAICRNFRQVYGLIWGTVNPAQDEIEADGRMGLTVQLTALGRLTSSF